MISVIVCSILPPENTLHERNVGKTIGAPHEYLRMDNRGTGRGICSVYNQAIAQAHGDILVFVHEDVFFLEPKWGEVLEQKFAASARLGLVGVAGTQYLYREKMSWSAAGMPFLKGRVVHELDDGKEFFMTLFSFDKSDADVVAVDGLFMAIRRTVLETVRFDEATFDAFHFYDLDICMQIRAAGYRMLVTWDLMVKHGSGGRPDDAWREQGRRFLAKYSALLPAWSTPAVPDLSGERRPGQSFDLKGKAPQEIIC